MFRLSNFLSVGLIFINNWGTCQKIHQLENYSLFTSWEAQTDLTINSIFKLAFRSSVSSWLSGAKRKCWWQEICIWLARSRIKAKALLPSHRLGTWQKEVNRGSGINFYVLLKPISASQVDGCSRVQHWQMVENHLKISTNQPLQIYIFIKKKTPP